MDSREICFIGGDLSSAGFNLAGVKTYALSEENKDNLVNELKEKKMVIIITQSAAQILGESIEKIKSKSLTITIPEKQGEEYLSLKSLIKSTIGFDLKGY